MCAEDARVRARGVDAGIGSAEARRDKDLPADANGGGHAPRNAAGGTRPRHQRPHGPGGAIGTVTESDKIILATTLANGGMWYPPEREARRIRGLEAKQLIRVAWFPNLGTRIMLTDMGVLVAQGLAHRTRSVT